MSRSEYSDDIDNWQLIRWRGQVASSVRGARGQLLLKDLLVSLDAMPEKKLIAHELEKDGCHCALGAVGVAKGLPIQEIDPEDLDVVAKTFNISNALAREIVFINDEGGFYDETPEKRWSRVRAWVAANIAAQVKS